MRGEKNAFAKIQTVYFCMVEEVEVEMLQVKRNWLQLTASCYLGGAAGVSNYKISV